MGEESFRELDLVFLCDCTGSMGIFIAAAQRSIKDIITTLQASEKADLQFAVICYRDHPPEDLTYVTKVFPFTSSVKEAQGYVDSMSASGGGDTPECIACAMKDILDLDFRKGALKVCVMISDAPPHGLVLDGDMFPGGCPSGNEPMEITAKLMERGIVLYCVGVEPSVCYGGTKEWFQALAKMTGGRYLPLADAAGLSKIILYGATEELDLKKIEDQIAEEEIRVRTEVGTEVDDEKVYQIVGTNLAARGVNVRHLAVDAVGAVASVLMNPEVVDKLTSAKSLTEVREILTASGIVRSAWGLGLGGFTGLPFAYGSSAVFGTAPSEPSEVVTYASKPDTGSLAYTSGSSAFFGSIPGGSAPEKVPEPKPAEAPASFFGAFSKPADPPKTGAFFGAFPTAPPPAEPSSSSSTFFGFGKVSATSSSGPFFGAVSGASPPPPAASSSGAFFGAYSPASSAPAPKPSSGAFFGAVSSTPTPSAPSYSSPFGFGGTSASAYTPAPTFPSYRAVSSSSTPPPAPSASAPSYSSPFGFSATSAYTPAPSFPSSGAVSSPPPPSTSSAPFGFSASSASSSTPAAASVGYTQVNSSISYEDVRRIRTRAKNMASSSGY